MSPETIAQLQKVQQQYPEYGIVSPIHTNDQATRLDRNFEMYMRYDMNADFYSDHVLGNPIKEIYDIPFVNAAGWLINNACLMKVGGFDPIFFHYGEDRNYVQRIKYHGFKIGVVSGAVMVHDREDRPIPKIIKYSATYFKLNERNLKVKYADINNFNEEVFDEIKRTTKREQFKAMILGKRKTVKGIKENLRLLDKIEPEINKSVELNKIVQPNYLKV